MRTLGGGERGVREGMHTHAHKHSTHEPLAVFSVVFQMRKEAGGTLSVLAISWGRG
jgi:hypothetical protein